MSKITRVGVTFPPELLSEFDAVIENIGYKSRSKAIQDTVRAFVNEQKWLADVEGTKAGSITMIYDHSAREIESDLTDTQHHFKSVIYASMHVHLSNHKCLETIAVKGDVGRIRRLVERLKAERGVEVVSLKLFTL